jgi:hypothetical protein
MSGACEIPALQIQHNKPPPTLNTSPTMLRGVRERRELRMGGTHLPPTWFDFFPMSSAASALHGQMQRRGRNEILLVNKQVATINVVRIHHLWRQQGVVCVGGGFLQ